MHRIRKLNDVDGIWSRESARYFCDFEIAAQRRGAACFDISSAAVAKPRNEQSTGNGGDGGGDDGDSSEQLASIIANGRLITDD
ncbi:hypothetical protein EAG_06119 [Camponotus floridanus]|uniref:Uncharacterized protein n=1 Tax=Camponotus floridanus TaxID=104421 RepID=E2A1D3_CAMFO|nr:hypothetical protein EAG_06119 [Camponotus floridanus]